MRILTAVLFIILSSCAGLEVPPLDSGKWQMCTYVQPSGIEITVPVPLNIPVGYKHPDGTQLSCVPLPGAPDPVR